LRFVIPRNSRPNPFKARGRSVVLLATAGVAVLGITALSVIGSSGAGSFGVAMRVTLLGLSVALNAAAFVFVFRIATARALTFRDVAAGAISAALIWQLLQSFGVVYVAHVVKNASATNGVFAFVLGLIAFLYLTAVAMLLCVQVNVVRVEHLCPRALLTLFTDNVTLTAQDRHAYSDQAKTQRMKGFEDVDVHFAPSSGDNLDNADQAPRDKPSPHE
jgi:membrane protein